MQSQVVTVEAGCCSVIADEGRADVVIKYRAKQKVVIGREAGN